MNEFAHVYGVHAANSYVVPQRVIDLIMNADTPRLGLLREHHSKAITWVRAWNKHGGSASPPIATSSASYAQMKYQDLQFIPRSGALMLTTFTAQV